MTGRHVTDAQVARALRAHLPERADPGLRERVLDAAAATGQQRTLPPVIGALGDADPAVRTRSLLLAAALLVALALASATAVGALRLLPPDPVRELSLLAPTAVPTPTDVVDPGLEASPSPSAPTAALTWTPASLKGDWPAPVRTEPAGPATVLPILNKTLYRDCPDNCGVVGHERGHYVDPTGDTGSDAFPWIDINGVGFCGIACLSPGLASHDLPEVDPTEQWMAYGVVFDTDRDGVPDLRYGVDNMPIEGRNGKLYRPHRAWRTDLHTGLTESAAGEPYGMVGKTPFDTYYPGRWSFGAEAAGGGTAGMMLDVPFYVWASEIEDGRVVATDYAPDVGWLLPSPNAKP